MSHTVPAHLQITYPEIADFCRRWGLAELALFGSVLRDDFTPTSDIDVLFKKQNDRRYTLDDLITMKDELEAMFGRKVDIVPLKVIESDANYLRRSEILGSAQVIYAE